MKLLLAIAFTWFGINFFAYTGTTANIDSWKYEANEQLQLSTNGLEGVFIDAGAGFLEISGEEGLNEIIVEAEILANHSEAEVQKHMTLSLEKEGNNAILKSQFDPQKKGRKWMGNWSSDYQINLTVRMPQDLYLKINDGSGDMSVENMTANLKINDGSGNIAIQSITGNVDLNDGSGNTSIESVNGNIDVDDGSGNLALENCIGSLNINDGSGNVSISDINGNVSVNDGSGNIAISNIAGNVHISDGSGNTAVNEVTQDVHFASQGSGSNSINNVAGKITGLKE